MSRCFVRTTIDIPDQLYRTITAKAMAERSTIKKILIDALERCVYELSARGASHRGTLGLIQAWKGPKLDLSKFDFDDLLV
jgi:hypothetical protein